MSIMGVSATRTLFTVVPRLQIMALLFPFPVYMFLLPESLNQSLIFIEQADRKQQLSCLPCGSALHVNAAKLRHVRNSLREWKGLSSRGKKSKRSDNAEEYCLGFDRVSLGNFVSNTASHIRFP